MATDYDIPTEDGPPKYNHMLLVTNAAMKRAMCIPPGALVAIEEWVDGELEELPLIIERITRRSLWFRCACGQPNCTRKFKAALRPEGQHPYEGKGLRLKDDD